MICRVLLFFPLLVSAQSTDVPAGVRLTPPANVPATVFDRFRLGFPKATPSWQRSGEDNWSASFTDDSTHLPRVAVYNNAGELVESRQRLDKGSYPKSVDEYFHANRPTDVYAVWRLERLKHAGVYYAVTSADTTWFSGGGLYERQMNSPVAASSAADAGIILNLWTLNQHRLSVLKVADKNGFVTETRMRQSQDLDAALRSLAGKKNIALRYVQDEKDGKRLEDLSKLHGEALSRSVNSDLRKNSADMNREFQRAEKSEDPGLQELGKKFIVDTR